jgi:quercetin dioxygenase-like cupin family protein
MEEIVMRCKKGLSFLTVAAVLAAAGTSLPVAAADTGAQVAQAFDQPISNIPGKSLIAVEVTYPPGGKSTPHRHAGSAFIMAYVISGAIRSQVEGEPVHVYHAGQTWYERPGAHHVVSENASETEPARLLAVFVTDTGHGSLTTFDAR